MKTKNSIIFLTSVSLFTIVIVTCIFNFSSLRRIFSIKPTLKSSYEASNLNDLINNSQLIIVAKSTSNQTQFTYQGVDFVKTQIRVTKLLKGTDPSINEITLLQTVSDEDPIVEKGGNLLLFLEKYDGPVTTNAYICKGLYQGHYKIKDNSIISSKNNDLNITNEIKKLGTIDNVKIRIDALK